MKKPILLVLASLIVGAGIGYITRGGIDLPNSSGAQGMNSMQHGTTTDTMVTELSELSGSSRDAEYLESMIVHHQSAVTMSQLLLETTRRPELKQLAENIIATQNTEITQMRGFLSQWYGR
ncbi:MAG: DUF305 domain-containing protein [Patescibacteria group bacterium]